MVRFLLLRLSAAACSLWLVSVMTFFSMALVPGDAASQALGERATPNALAHWRHQFGLDQPIMVRYGQWLADMLRGDGGMTLVSQQPVSAVIGPAARRSAMLALTAAVIMLLVGVSGGIVTAVYQARWPDRLCSMLALITLSTPEFIVATLLIMLFSVTLGWLPAVSLPPLSGGWRAYGQILLLPALTLGLVAGSYVLRMVRATLLYRLHAPWVMSARLNGVDSANLLWRHVLPGAVAPIAQIVAATLPYLLGGAIVVERLFGYPGLGEVLIMALNARDSLLLQAVAMLLALCAMLCWLAADVFARATTGSRG